MSELLLVDGFRYPQVIGDAQVLAPQQRVEVEDELLAAWRRSPEAWAKAHAAWLDASSASEHTRRAYEYATRAFFEFCGVDPWLVNGAHVQGWQQAMLRAGLSRATVNQRLAALSSYYDYCMRSHVYTAPLTLREFSLIDHNPVRRVKRTRVESYQESMALSSEQARALLAQIDRTRLVGLRDYALVLAYLLTGARNSEIRTLRWGDIFEQGEKVFFHWRGKRGKQDREELPRPVYEAICVYLEAAGRLGTIRDEEYVFTALSDVATRLPHVAQMPENQPLTSAMVNRIVKKCARRAGLKWERIHTHTLRHSAALMYYEQSGRDVRRVQRQLHHSKPATTMIYLDHLENQENDLWPDVAALLGVTATGPVE